MPAEEGTVPPPVLLSALELWGGGSGPAGAKVLPSVGGSGGWKAGAMCFLVRVPPRRWAWKSISFTPKLHRKKKQSTQHASRLVRQKSITAHVTTRARATRLAPHAVRQQGPDEWSLLLPRQAACLGFKPEQATDVVLINVLSQFGWEQLKVRGQALYGVGDITQHAHSPTTQWPPHFHVFGGWGGSRGQHQDVPPRCLPG